MNPHETRTEEKEREAWIDYLAAALALAETQADQAKSELARCKRLCDEGAGSDANYEQARCNLQIANLQVGRIESLAKLVAILPVERLSASVSL